MRRLFRRLLGRSSVSADWLAGGALLTEALIQGLKDPRPLTEEELAEMMAHSEGVARRSFSTLYDDET